MLRRLAFWAAIPFVLPQAIYVYRTAPRFAGAGGPSEGTATNGAPKAASRLTVHAVGDSIIAGVGASDFSKALIGRTAAALARQTGHDVDWSAHGRIGARSTDLLTELIDGMAAEPADVILVSIGVNDVTGLRRTTSWIRNLEAIIHRLRAHSPKAVIAFTGLPPLSEFPLLPQPLRTIIALRGRTFDQAAQDVLRRHDRVVHVPIDVEAGPDKFADDGFHPSEVSYVEFADTVSNAIVAEMGNRRT